REFQRILAPGGWAVLMWNVRDLGDPLTAAYSHAMAEHSPEPAVAARNQAKTGELLLTVPFFEHQEEREFSHQQTMDIDGLLGRAFSVSFAPRDGTSRERLDAALRAAFAHHQRDGLVTMRYRTVLYLGQKPQVI